MNIKRYMSFTRFLSLVENGLSLPKATLFTDRWEGLLPYCDKSGRPVSDDNFVLIKRHHEWMYVSCWTCESLESYAMWKIYGRDELAIIIETTKEKLAEAYSRNKGNTTAYIGEVEYHLPGKREDNNCVKSISKSTTFNPPDCVMWNGSAIFLYRKHKTYEFEKELRLVGLDPRATIERDNLETDLKLPVHSDPEFIDRIIVSPGTPNCFREAVERIKDHAGWKAEVSTSSLDVPR